MVGSLFQIVNGADQRIVAGTAHHIQLAVDHDPLHGHLVFGEGSGLVGTDYCGAAEGLYGRQFTDNSPIFGHTRDTDSKSNGNRCR